MIIYIVFAISMLVHGASTLMGKTQSEVAKNIGIKSEILQLEYTRMQAITSLIFGVVLAILAFIDLPIAFLLESEFLSEEFIWIICFVVATFTMQEVYKKKDSKI